MKLLLLNATANTGSTGRIAEEIGLLAQQSGYEVRFAYGRKAVNSKLPLIKIGNVPIGTLENYQASQRQRKPPNPK